MRRESLLDENGEWLWPPAAPVAGESLNRPDESQLSSVRFLLSPLVVLRTPALICDQRATGEGWVRESALAECDSW